MKKKKEIEDIKEGKQKSLRRRRIHNTILETNIGLKNITQKPKDEHELHYKPLRRRKNTQYHIGDKYWPEKHYTES